MATQTHRPDNVWASINLKIITLSMQVTVKLFGALREFLPPGSGFNSCQLSFAPGQSLGDLLSQLPIPGHKPYLVIINDEKINQQDLTTAQIQENDEIVLLPPIKGG